MHEACDALVLYPSGFTKTEGDPVCWASAILKSGNGTSLDLAGPLTLAPQAVLLVNKSRWTPPHGFEPPKVRAMRAMVANIGPGIKGWTW